MPILDPDLQAALSNLNERVTLLETQAQATPQTPAVIGVEAEEALLAAQRAAAMSAMFHPQFRPYGVGPPADFHRP